MSRRFTGHMRGERYLANVNPSKREVHDLEREQKNCQIDEIIRNGNDRPYDSLDAAHRAGFDNCDYCLGNSSR